MGHGVRACWVRVFWFKPASQVMDMLTTHGFEAGPVAAAGGREALLKAVSGAQALHMWHMGVKVLGPCLRGTLCIGLSLEISSILGFT